LEEFYFIIKIYLCPVPYKYNPPTSKAAIVAKNNIALIIGIKDI
jgi:hypothetical protein